MEPGRNIAYVVRKKFIIFRAKIYGTKFIERLIHFSLLFPFFGIWNIFVVSKQQKLGVAMVTFLAAFTAFTAFPFSMWTISGLYGGFWRKNILVKFLVKFRESYTFRGKQVLCSLYILINNKCIAMRVYYRLLGIHVGFTLVGYKGFDSCWFEFILRVWETANKKQYTLNKLNCPWHLIRGFVTFHIKRRIHSYFVSFLASEHFCKKF